MVAHSYQLKKIIKITKNKKNKNEKTEKLKKIFRTQKKKVTMAHECQI